jgi:beta-glucosidase/6-phospho-beta-glucosidase/beta-galactosidase
MANHFIWGEPITDHPDDIIAAQRLIDFNYGWFADPLYFGSYPTSLRDNFNILLPEFTPEESALIKGSQDFVAINHYTSIYVARYGFKEFDSDGGNILIPFSRLHFSAVGDSIGLPGAPVWLFSVPWGFGRSLDYIKNRFGNPEIYVTENGFSPSQEFHMPRPLALHDNQRVEYYSSYLSSMLKAVKNGANVKGYMAWSFIIILTVALTNNWEWAVGFEQPFGVAQFDIKTGKRYLKDSAYFLRDFFGKAIKKE